MENAIALYDFLETKNKVDLSDINIGEYNIFYSSIDKLLKRLEEEYELWNNECTFAEYLETQDIKRTSHGYVLCLEC